MDSKEIEKRKLAFDDYAQIDEESGTEYWSARDIMRPLGYAQWRNFETAIKRAMVSCETNKIPVESHFAEASKIVGESGDKRT